MGVLTQFSIENNTLKFGIIQKIFVHIADFSFVFSVPNCADTSKLHATFILWLFRHYSFCCNGCSSKSQNSYCATF